MYKENKSEYKSNFHLMCYYHFNLIQINITKNVILTFKRLSMVKLIPAGSPGCTDRNLISMSGAVCRESEHLALVPVKRTG